MGMFKAREIHQKKTTPNACVSEVVPKSLVVLHHLTTLFMPI